ncbi:proline and serine-rich protein 2 [Xenopus laevis]|uniref:Proline and serine-rich protein 2 n=2 Tax=Xenopus laevis TaxID=8355 RepID=A0A974DAG8_XENLA|nr:proline and serine-rich protein 2 [Xenopus laevis]OCT87225.1 hypothetical protein XELAEV_18020923mg [Xenopus laevis]
MPSNLIKLSSSEMEPDFHSRKFSDSERSGSFNSQGSRRSRSRSSNLDDENLKYLTSEEKNALLFFEETLDAFEDDIEETPVSQDDNFGYYSLISTDGSHSENEEIIDLVQAEENLELHTLPNSKDIQECKDGKQTQMNTSVPVTLIHTSSPVTTTVATTTMASPKEKEILSPEFPIEHKKLLGAIPTPVVIAKKISERNADNLNPSQLSPSEGKQTELKKSVGTSPIGEGNFIFTGPPNSRPHNFPNNISVKQVGKQYNKTIAKAAVNVQERKAKVLANINGQSLLDDETDSRVNYEQLSRKTSFRDVTAEQARYEALTKLGLVKDTTVQAGIQTVGLPTSPVSNAPMSPKFLQQDSHKRYSYESQYVSNSIKNEPLAFAHSKSLPRESPKRYVNENQNISSVKSEPSPLELSKSLPHEYTRLSIQKSNTSNIIKIDPSVPTSPKSLPYEYPRRYSNENQNIGSNLKSGPTSPTNLASNIPRTYSNENQSSSLQHEVPRRYSNDNQNSGSIKSGSNTHIPHETPRRYSNENNRNVSNDNKSISNILKSEPSPFVPLGKTVIFKGEASPEKNIQPIAPHDNNEQKKSIPHQDIRRTYSMPRPTGFRPQGITVQFSGRDASEETRKDALRKLGLLKEKSF